MPSRVRAIGLFVLPLALALAACDGPFDFAGRAGDEWIRSYPLADGGQVQISNSNGIGRRRRRDRIHRRRPRRANRAAPRPTPRARAAAAHGDQGRRHARRASRSDSERVGGISDRRRVRGPLPRARCRSMRSCASRRPTASITADGVVGRVTAATTNGERERRGAERRRRGASRPTAACTMELAALGAGDVDLRTTNGASMLTLPPDGEGQPRRVGHATARISVDGPEVRGVGADASPSVGAHQRRRHADRRLDDERSDPHRTRQ